MCCYFLFILRSYFLSPWEKNMFYFPSSSSWVIIWKRYQLTYSGWVHCTLLVSKQREVVPLHIREYYSMIQGTPFVHTIKEDSYWQDPYPFPWRWWEGDPTPYTPSSFAPLVHQRWAVHHAQPSTPARVVRMGAETRASASGGEGICWGSALKQLQPSPPTPPSARAQDILLGSTRAPPWCQKQDLVLQCCTLCSLQPWGFSPNFSRNDSKIWCHSRRNMRKEEFTNALQLCIVLCTKTCNYTEVFHGIWQQIRTNCVI